MITRVTDTWKNLNEMSNETAASVKNLLFLFIIIDVFGIYWYLKMKSLGSALLMVLLICLAFVMFIEQRNERGDNRYTEPILDNGKKQMTVKCDECNREFATQNELAQHIMAKHFKKKQNKEKSKEEPEDETSFGLGSLGFPDSEEYNKRIEKGLGGGFEI